MAESLINSIFESSDCQDSYEQDRKILERDFRVSFPGEVIFFGEVTRIQKNISSLFYPFFSEKWLMKGLKNSTCTIRSFLVHFCKFTSLSQIYYFPLVVRTKIRHFRCGSGLATGYFSSSPDKPTSVINFRFNYSERPIFRKMLILAILIKFQVPTDFNVQTSRDAEIIVESS